MNRRMGQPPVGPNVERRILALRARGFGIHRIAREAGCGVGTVQRVLT